MSLADKSKAEVIDRCRLVESQNGLLAARICELEKRLVEAEAAMVRRSGASSWEEWIGVWDPTQETAVDATERLFARADMAEKQRDSLLNALSAERAEQILGVYAKLFLDCTNDTLRAYRDAAREVGK